ncbi:MAG: hypothetical protein NTW07_09275 [candidate division Zixibacteria bacterium]|nr:hypothetical protein [candidate division Zixibacteria bacterium]
MKRVTIIVILAVASIAAVALGMLAGCGEKDVPYVIDSEEITRYINEVGIAKELFRTSDLINSTPYTLPSDSATFYDSLLSVRRSMEIFLVPLKIRGSNGDSVANDPDRIYIDYGILGRVRECMVRVEDRFTIHVTRMYADTTLHDTTVLLLNRYAFFLKLGDDTRPYVGWVLWGFNGIGSTTPLLGVALEGSAGASFRGDLGLYPNRPRSSTTAIPEIPYIRLTDMDTVIVGSRLLVTVNKASDALPTWQLLSDHGEGGAFTRSMVRYDFVNCVDSLSYQTPSSNPRLYNQLMIQMLPGQSFLNRHAFVVPYRR